MKILIKKEFNNQLSQNTNAIVLSGKNFVPPHIGLIISGQYFSCSANKVKTGLPFEKVFNNFKRSGYKLIIAELNFQPSKKLAIDIFKNHGLLINGKTCLYPVKNTIEKFLDKKFDADFVYEFLPTLEKNGFIKQYLHFGLNEQIQKNHFELIKYSKEEILNCIKELQFSNDK
jgi:hypothetical protein